MTRTKSATESAGAVRCYQRTLWLDAACVCAVFLPESNRHSHDDYLHAHDLILTCELQQVVRNPCDGARETIVEVVGAIAHGHALVVHDARVLAVRSVLLGTRPVPHLER